MTLLSLSGIFICQSLSKTDLTNNDEFERERELIEQLAKQVEHIQKQLDDYFHSFSSVVLPSLLSVSC